MVSLKHHDFKHEYAEDNKWNNNINITSKQRSGISSPHDDLNTDQWNPKQIIEFLTKKPRAYFPFLFSKGMVDYCIIYG